MRNFGALLRKLRIQQGFMRQYEAAARCDLSASYWSKLERGQTTGYPPSVEIIERIVAGLDLSPDDLDALLEASGQSTPVAHLAPVRKLLQVLREEDLRQDIQEHLEQDIKEITDCWVDYTKAKASQYQRNWDDAVNYCDRAHARIQRLAGRLSAYLLDTKAAALLHHNRLEQVAAIHHEIQDMVAQADDPYLAAINLVHQGDQWRAGDQWVQAMQFYVRAYDRFSSTPMRQREMARCQRKIATTYLHQGNWRQAHIYLKSAHETLETLYRENPVEGRYELARVYYIMGWAANLGGNWDAALSYHQEGARLAKEFATKHVTSDRFLVMLGHSYLGNDERQRDNLDLAQEHYDAAQDLCRELGCQRERAWLMLGLARLESQRARLAATADGGPNDALYKQARKRFDEALECAQTTGSKYIQTMMLTHYAQLELDRRTPEGDQQASAHLNTALHFAVELGADYYVAAAKRQICELYVRKRDFDLLHHLAADVEELHRRHVYYNHMAWLRTVEARAVLATASTLESQEVQADVARRYADALAYGVCFNQPWARAILADLARTLQPLASPIQEAIRDAVAQQLRDHPEISSYQRDRQRLRDNIAGALSAMETIPA